MRRRGITLVELLLALTISALVMMAAGSAYTFGARTTKRLGDGRDVFARRAAFERSLGDLFDHVYLDADTTNLNTYFVSGDALSGTSAAGGLGGSASGAGSSEGSLVFTVLGRRLPSTLLSSDEDFETNNEKFGAVAGVTEIQLGTTPVGSPSGEQATGLFLREQTPSDADATQGGEESLLSPDVETIRFEFFDGTDWVTTWDTVTMVTKRLPAAVRVTYKFVDEDDERTLVFTLRASDVTPAKPIEQETA